MFSTLTQIQDWCAKNRWAWTVRAQGIFQGLLDTKQRVTAEMLAEAAEGHINGEGPRTATQLAVRIQDNLKGDGKKPRSEHVKTRSWAESTLGGKEGPISQMRREWMDMGIRMFGKEAMLREVGRNMQVPSVGDDEGRAAYAAAANESRQQRVDKHLLHRVCIDYMGAPRRQMGYVVAADGQIGRGGQLPGGGRLVLDETMALARVHDWCQGGRPQLTLVLSGVQRIGKTTASLLPLWHDAKRNPTPMRPRSFYSAFQMARIACSNYDCDLRAVDSMYHVRTLVIDHLGAEAGSARANATFRCLLQDVLEQRQNAGVATIITTNLTDGQLRKVFGESIHGHMVEPRGNVVDLPAVPVDQAATAIQAARRNQQVASNRKRLIDGV